MVHVRLDFFTLIMTSQAAPAIVPLAFVVSERHAEIEVYLPDYLDTETVQTVAMALR